MAGNPMLEVVAEDLILEIRSIMNDPDVGVNFDPVHFLESTEKALLNGLKASGHKNIIARLKEQNELN